MAPAFVIFSAAVRVAEALDADGTIQRRFVVAFAALERGIRQRVVPILENIVCRFPKREGRGKSGFAGELEPIALAV